MGEALRLDDIGHAYGGVWAVRDLSLAVGEGELVCLLGPSGCGKTTALRIASGLELLQQGRVRIQGKVVADRATNVPPELRGIGLVFQDYALFPHLRVVENVGFGLRGLPSAEWRKRALAALDRVGMASFADAYPHTLSGGQQQRVALARALAPGPRIMLLDEPFSGLDARLRDQVRDQTLHVLKGSGTAALIVTHDPDEAMFMADRIALMRQGGIVQYGTPSDLYYHPICAFAAAFFSDVNRLRSVVMAGFAPTPFGALPAGGMADGTPVEILIRPEALRLAQGTGAAARVLAARLLGRTSLVHLETTNADGPPVHLHARVPGRFLPPENETLSVTLDQTQAFVFPANATT